MEKRQVGQTGLMIDTLGLGGAPLGGNFIDLDYRQAAELIETAKQAGIGYFDTAPWYGFGRSERVMGDLLRHTDYILSDKVGRLLKPGPVDNPSDFGMVDPLPFHVVYDYGYDGIMRAFEDNLQRLGLDRIDILLAHDIGTFTHGDENERHFRDLAEGGYRAMDEIRRAGHVKAIGLGVNENAICMDTLGIGSWDVSSVTSMSGEHRLCPQRGPRDRAAIARLRGLQSLALRGPMCACACGVSQGCSETRPPSRGRASEAGM